MSGIVFGCIVPHPPLLVPGVGGGRDMEVSRTIDGMKELTRRLAAGSPQTVALISPHGVMLYDSMGVATAPRLHGTMRNWGTRREDRDFDNDPDLVAAVQAEAQVADIPLGSIGDRDYSLDHGVMVPIHFLADGMQGARLMPLTFSLLPLSDLHAAATTDTEKAIYLAAGEALSQVSTATPQTLGFLLMAGAGLIISIVILRSHAFVRSVALSRAMGYVGIAGSVAALANFGGRLLAPSIAEILMPINGLLWFVWWILASVNLFRLARKTPAQGSEAGAG